ncbi:MAG TPA: response regulator transcription factor [Acidimicrobiales bacterium]|jgi:two-component system response regulator RegX3|nr:response regulator transcription factor [Acidimicrobiales bacterium]
MAPAELSPSVDGHAHLDGRQHAGFSARPACCVPGRTAAAARNAMPQAGVAAPRPGAPALVMNGTTPTTTSEVTTRPHELVLVVDDEESYRDALSIGLSQEGFDVVVAADGAEARAAVRRDRPDLVLLDVMLPDISGIELCREIRAERDVPVIMVTARDGEVDVVLALELGAADYVAKPYRLRELVARMRAVLRRRRDTGGDDQVVSAGGVRLDLARHDASVDGSLLELSRKEFELLALLISRAGQVVTREECIDTLWWGQDLADTRTLDTHVKRIRRKIEKDPAAPVHLVTVRGIGFRFDP